ncbi:MAG: PhoH family protein, partial [Acidobacteriota bacterium]
MKKIPVPEQDTLALFGTHDENLKSIERSLDVKIVSRGEELLVEGEPRRVAAVQNIFSQFSELAGEGYRISAGDLRVALRLVRQDPDVSLRDYFITSVIHPSKKKAVMPRSLNQLRYLEAIEANDIVLGI